MTIKDKEKILYMILNYLSVNVIYCRCRTCFIFIHKYEYLCFDKTANIFTSVEKYRNIITGLQTCLQFNVTRGFPDVTKGRKELTVTAKAYIFLYLPST